MIPPRQQASAACAVHRWTPWRPLAGGLLERRCACGSVERGTYEAVNADELERLRVVIEAWRRAVPAKDGP